MDFIYLHQFSPLQAPVLSTRCPSPQQLLCTGPKALPGQSVGSHSLVWAKPSARTVPIMEQSRALWDRDGHVPWHCLVWEHPGSFRAPPGCQHIPGKSGWGSFLAGAWAFFVMNTEPVPEDWKEHGVPSEQHLTGVESCHSLQDCTWVLH